MTISSLNTTSYQSSIQTALKQRMTDFKALKSALDSGDLASAQKAFSALEKDNKALTSNGSKTPSDQISSDMDALKSALGNNDLSGAQSAFSTLSNDLQAERKNHMHGPPPPPPTDATDSTDDSSSSSSDSDNTDSSSSFLNSTNSISQAIDDFIGTLLNTKA